MDRNDDLLHEVLAELREVRGRLADLEDAHASLLAQTGAVATGGLGVAPLAPVPTIVMDDDDDDDDDDDLDDGDLDDGDLDDDDDGDLDDEGGAVEAAGGRRSRRAILGAAAVAVGGAVVGALTGAEPAAANQGTMLYGNTNDSIGDTTKLRSNNGTQTLTVENYGSGVALNVTGPGGINIAATAGNAIFATAVGASAVNASSQSGAGALLGADSGIGAVVSSNSNTGVQATSGSASGVVGISSTVSGATRPRSGVIGDSSSGNGVSGLTTDGVGVQGTANGGGNGVNGNATSGTALRGIATNGTGAFGQSTTGIGVQATVTSVNATSAAVQSTQGGNGQAGLFVLSNPNSTGVAVRAVGDHAQLCLATLTPVRNPPTADASAHDRGEMVLDKNNDLWLCVAAGTPGTWRKLGGPSTAGQQHLFAAPIRVYDSRAGANPTSVGPKTKLVANTARPIDATLGGTAVPAGATGALVNILILNAPNASANFTIWANGATRPSANTMVWGGSATRFSSLSVTGLDATGSFQVLSSVGCDVALDVVGYYL